MVTNRLGGLCRLQRLYGHRFLGSMALVIPTEKPLFVTSIPFVADLRYANWRGFSEDMLIKQRNGGNSPYSPRMCLPLFSDRVFRLSGPIWIDFGDSGLSFKEGTVLSLQRGLSWISTS